MAIQVQQREKEGISIVDLTGPLTAGEGASAVREKLNELLGGGRNNAILNLRGVEYIDSTGLGTMVVCYTSLRKAGGRLVLLNLNRRHIELLILTKLSTVFELFDDEQSAVNSFFPAREIKRFDILGFIEQQRDR